MNVAFLAVEAEPFIKVGGLGDVAGSLPPALRNFSDDVRLILPLHGAIREQGLLLNDAGSFPLVHKGISENVRIFSYNHRGAMVYFIDSPFIRADLPVYSRDDVEDGWRYGLFSLAALTFLQKLDWHVDILHANDWHTSLAVYALAKTRHAIPVFSQTKSVLSVHNLPYSGSDASYILEEFDLPKSDQLLIPEWSRNAHLPLGLAAADQIVAVSPTYAREILTSEFGSGYERFLRSRGSSVSGILNGINYESWDPSNDPYILNRYDLHTLDIRKQNRDALQRSLGLAVDPDAMLIGLISRMDYQKGIDLLPEALYQMLMIPDQPAFHWQLVVLGTGDQKIEREISQLEQDFPSKVRVSLRFDQRLSHQIYASADLLLIPSRYEPCGLTQMIGMRYGCVPLARATGGLLDTICDDDAGDQRNGFLFREATSEALLETIIRVSKYFGRKKIWKNIQHNGMQANFSWDVSAGQYHQLFMELIERKVGN